MAGSALEPPGRDPVAAGWSEGRPAFSVYNPDAGGLPIVMAVPHAGRDYCAETLAAMRNPAQTPLRLEDRHADTLALAIAREVEMPLLVANTPRAVIDLNRAEDDIDWGMVEGGWSRAVRHSAANRRARSGLGLIPRRLPGDGEIWRRRFTQEDISRRLDTLHRPYHDALFTLLERQRHKWGAALLIDLHSMPPLAPRLPGDTPAQIVVGDRFGAACAPALSASALHSLASMAWRSAHNRPYAGGYVLERHGRPRRNIHAMQIEVCRACYLDAKMVDPGPNFEDVASRLARLVRDLAEQTAHLGQRSEHRLAAE